MVSVVIFLSVVLGCVVGVVIFVSVVFELFGKCGNISGGSIGAVW